MGDFFNLNEPKALFAIWVNTCASVYYGYKAAYLLLATHVGRTQTTGWFQFILPGRQNNTASMLRINSNGITKTRPQ